MIMGGWGISEGASRDTGARTGSCAISGCPKVASNPGWMGCLLYIHSPCTELQGRENQSLQWLAHRKEDHSDSDFQDL